jgi:cellulose synthase (UDP-forming)
VPNQNNPKKHKFTASEVRGIFLVLMGLITCGYYYSWWFTSANWSSWWLLPLFVMAVLYGTIQILGNWLVYLATHYRRAAYTPADPDLSVDTYVTAYNEPVDMIRRALKAARDMRGHHKTYLLDDGHNPALVQLARELGVGYLTRPDRKDAKAGNLNAALKQTNGDIVVIFDIDHAPRPEFLERTLGYFNDPEVGFVQVMLTFESEPEWVSKAAADTSLDFYNPTSVGTDGLNSTTLIGSNALIRRQALADIDGYQPGLAEDLATSINLHAAGWRSVYVHEPLAPGIAPPDPPAWFTQQLKWARGVFELLVTSYPRLFLQLKFGQRVAYGLRMTYYWIGVVFCLHLVTALTVILRQDGATIAAFEQYLWHLGPLAVMVLLIRMLALRRWRHRSINQKAMQWQPLALVLATWPIYTAAWLMALLRLPLGFRPTPKATSSGGLNPVWLLPQWSSVLLLAVGLVYQLSQNGLAAFPLTYGFVLALIGLQLPLLWYWLRGHLNAPASAKFPEMELAPSVVQLNKSQTSHMAQ